MGNIIIALAIILLIVVVVMGISEMAKAIYKSTLRYETSYEDVPVRKKEYVEGYTTTMVVGRGLIMPQTHNDMYNVFLMYDGEQYCIDDKELYDKVNVGDIITVQVHKGYNKKKQLCDVQITK